VPARGQVTLGVLVLPQINPPTPGQHRHQTWFATSLDYGLTRKLEIGLERLRITDWPVTIGGFAKYQFLSESVVRPAVAAGFVYTGFGHNNLPPNGNIHTRSAFIAARKGFLQNSRFPVVGHLGIEYIDVSEGVVRHTVQPYAGAELELAPRVILVGEGRPRGRGDVGTPLALSLAYRYSRSGRIVLSWANTGQSERPVFGFGIGIGIGERR
jgi:hypothetical protein